MNTRIFILCAGDSRKFGGTLKQLLTINGEEILRRTIRLFRNICNDEIFIVTRNNVIKNNIMELNNSNIYFIYPMYDRCALETVMSTSEEWVDKNIFLYGDVIFSMDAVKRIINSENKINFFIRKKPHLYLNKRYPEIFGVSISIPLFKKNEIIEIIIEIVDKIFKTLNRGIFKTLNRGIFKTLYKKITGIDLEHYFDFQSNKARKIIGILFLNYKLRSIFYKLIQTMEERILRFIFYRFNSKKMVVFMNILLGKKIPNFELGSEYDVEIHDTTDDIDSLKEYNDYVKFIVKKGLLK